MRKSLFPIVAAMVVAVAFCLLGNYLDHATAGNRDAKASRFFVSEQQGERSGGIFVTDSETGQTVSIVSDHTGCFVAFYGPHHKSGTPKFAVGGTGLQVVDTDGRLHFISLNELVRLDTDGSPVPKRK